MIEKYTHLIAACLAASIIAFVGLAASYHNQTVRETKDRVGVLELTLQQGIELLTNELKEKSTRRGGLCETF